MFKQMGNMGKMMKQAQQMQAKMAVVQSELKDMIFEESTAGIVSVKVNGEMKLLDLKLTPDAMTEEPDVLEDVLITTVNKALIKAKEGMESRMNEATGGMMDGLKLPGM